MCSIGHFPASGVWDKLGVEGCRQLSTTEGAGVEEQWFALSLPLGKFHHLGEPLARFGCKAFLLVAAITFKRFAFEFC